MEISRNASKLERVRSEVCKRPATIFAGCKLLHRGELRVGCTLMGEN